MAGSPDTLKPLRRASTRVAQIGLTLGLGALLGLPGAWILTSARGSFVMYAVGGAFSLVALLLLYSGVHQIFAAGTPQTIVETDADRFVRGSIVRLRVRQPGPASFESLRGNLVGEERWQTRRRGKWVQHVQQLGTFNLFDTGAFEAPLDRTFTVTIPDLPHASDPEHAVDWRLEVWGVVRGRADVQHVFPVRICGSG